MGTGGGDLVSAEGTPPGTNALCLLYVLTCWEAVDDPWPVFQKDTNPLDDGSTLK